VSLFVVLLFLPQSRWWHPVENKWLGVTLGCFLVLCRPGLLYAQDMSVSAAVPTREDTLLLTEMASGTQFEMLGMRNKQNLEFTLRSDQIVKSAALNLIFTPSPALLPQLSHLRVYLNDELAGIVDMDNAANGEQLT